jgi:hypothetical protein
MKVEIMMKKMMKILMKKVDLISFIKIIYFLFLDYKEGDGSEGESDEGKKKKRNQLIK